MTAAKQKRPTSIHVNGLDWAVRWLTTDEWSEDNLDDDVRGLTRYSQREVCVLIESVMHEDVLRDTLMHELQHVVWDAAAIGQARDVHSWPKSHRDAEEYLVLRTTPTWLNILQYNPVMIEYLTGAS